MRKLTCYAAATLLTLNACAQGWVNFSNIGGQLVTNFCTGQPIAVGSTFLAALYYADDSISDEALFVQLGGSTAFGPRPGLFSAGSRSAPTPVVGGFGMFQLKAWEADFGMTYEQALNAPPINGRTTLLGKSVIFRVNTADIFSPFDEIPSLGASGFQGFKVGSPETCIPEPAPFSLVVLGLVAAWILHQKRHKRARMAPFANARKDALTHAVLAGTLVTTFPEHGRIALTWVAIGVHWLLSPRSPFKI
jgi:hypothetical protein